MTRKATGVSLGDLMGRNRMQLVAQARNLCFWLLRTHMPMSYPEIGKMFDRDHTTVMAGVRSASRHVERCDDWTMDCIREVGKLVESEAA